MAQGDSFRAGQITLTGAAQKLTGLSSGSSAALKNPGATNTIYLGSDNTVSASTGWPISPGETYSLDVLNSSKMWVIGTAADKLAWSVLS
jgi:hypothetical protein